MAWYQLQWQALVNLLILPQKSVSQLAALQVC
jgi:hypothetical protein